MLLAACLLTGIFPTFSGMVSAADYETAWFPAPKMNITQIAYETYSHGQQNAIDFVPGGDVFAPFTGKIVQMNAKWGFVLFQSTNKVYFANGTLDYMTVGFMHDNNISDLRKGQIIKQGTKFYQAGTAGLGKGAGAHVDMSVFKGKVNSVSRFGRGNTYAFDAFYINKAKTSITTQSKFGALNPKNKVNNNAPTDWRKLWRYTGSNTSTPNPAIKPTPSKKFATVSGYNTPSSITQGGVFSVRGTITSDTNLTYIVAGVYTAASGGKVMTGATVRPYTKSYSIAKLDKYIYFNRLSAGRYYYRVSATNSAGTKVLINSPFNVTEKATYPSISGYNVPPKSLKAGRAFSIKGVLSSTTKITSVTAGVYTSEYGGVMKTGKTVRPNTTTYNLKKIDPYVYFNRLPRGSYWYRVNVTNGAAFL